MGRDQHGMEMTSTTDDEHGEHALIYHIYVQGLSNYTCICGEHFEYSQEAWTHLFEHSKQKENVTDE